MTIDGGQNITLHGSTNIGAELKLMQCLFLASFQLRWSTISAEPTVLICAGPWWTSEKYNLNVYGDLTVGAVLPIDPESATNDVNVEGSVITSKLVLRDASATDVGLPALA
jgi:hypothetical protein